MSPIEDTAIDAVFVIGTGSKNNNEELKYALRNLEKNCPFIRNVYLSGECPPWVDTTVVNHLKWPDRFSHAKDANIIDKLRHACEQPGIASRILFCSDDQFQTRVCTWEDFAPRWLRKYSENDSWYEDRKRIWHTRLRNTLERDRMRRLSQKLDPTTVYYYQPHMWMQIDRDRFIEYAKWSNYEKREDTIIASGYFNFIDAGGNSNFDHIFIAGNQQWPVKETHIAYSDPSFLAAMDYLKKNFPTPSKYEINKKKPTKTKSGQGSAQASSSIGLSEKTASRTDEAIIEDIKKKIIGDPAWSSLKSEIEEAEKLRANNFVGWRKVWNDIIHRWAETTEKGKLHIPVTLSKSEEAMAIVHSYKKTLSNKSSEDKDTISGKKKCTKCEEKRRKAQEELVKKEKEALAKMGNANEPTYASAVQSVAIKAADTASAKAESGKSQVSGCLDCAIEHLSIAIAYMNSNMARPGSLEVELARGEVVVASQHLLALRRNEAYNMCSRALYSVYSANSLFSVVTLREILTKVINDR